VLTSFKRDDEIGGRQQRLISCGRAPPFFQE